MGDQLLPCPFCGGEPSGAEPGWNEKYYNLFYVSSCPVVKPFSLNF